MPAEVIYVFGIILITYSKVGIKAASAWNIRAGTVGDIVVVQNILPDRLTIIDIEIFLRDF
jgi:hypothetical protein